MAADGYGALDSALNAIPAGKPRPIVVMPDDVGIAPPSPHNPNGDMYGALDSALNAIPAPSADRGSAAPAARAVASGAPSLGARFLSGLDNFGGALGDEALAGGGKAAGALALAASNFVPGAAKDAVLDFANQKFNEAAANEQAAATRDGIAGGAGRLLGGLGTFVAQAAGAPASTAANTVQNGGKVGQAEAGLGTDLAAQELFLALGGAKPGANTVLGKASNLLLGGAEKTRLGAAFGQAARAAAVNAGEQEAQHAITPDITPAPSLASVATDPSLAFVAAMAALTHGHGAIAAKGDLGPKVEPAPTDTGTPPPAAPSAGDAKLDAAANALRDIGAKAGVDVDAEAARIRAGEPGSAALPEPVTPAANHPEIPEGSIDTSNDHPLAQIRDAERGPAAEPAPEASQPEPAPEDHATADNPVREVPLRDITGLDADVPQFKKGASETGEVEPLQGDFDRRGLGPIQLWQRNDGSMTVISGRHRYQHALRTGQETIPAQVYREADGFTKDMAASLDAELNIRDGQGSVADYVQHFQRPAFQGTDGRAEAESRGLLARATGRRAYALARQGDPELVAAHRAGQITDEQAVQIAQAAPNDQALQTLGMQRLQQGDTLTKAVNVMRAAKSIRGDRPAQQGDIFGLNDSGMRDASAMADAAAKRQRDIGQRLAAISGAAKRPEVARAEGIDVHDPGAVRQRIAELRAERDSWENWETDPAKVAQLRSEAGLEPTGEPASQKSVQTAPSRGTAAGGLFPAPTAGERNRAAAEAKDAARNGRVGGREDAGDGGLFDGPRPEQGRIDEPKRSEPADAQTTDSGVPEGLPVAQTDATRRLARAVNRPVRIGRSNNEPARFREVDPHSLPHALSRALRALERFGNLKVHVIRNLNADESGVRFNGVTMKDGHLYVDERAEALAVTIASHEFLHQLKRDAPDLYQQLVDEVARQAREAPEKSSAWVKEATRRGYKAAETREELVGDATGDALSDPAFLRRMAERNPSAFRDMAQRFIEFINKFLGSARDLGSNQYLTDVAAFRDKLADVLDTYARERVQDVSMPRRGTLDVRPGDPDYQRRVNAEDQTDTPAFRNWFKNSKAVDAEGRPLTVYHGTSEDFNAFDNTKLGANTGHMTSPLGHFLTEDRRSAKAYADKAAGYVEPESRVIDAHLSMQKPKEMAAKEFQAIDSFDEARTLRAKLEREGYDGIHIPEYKQWVAFKPEQIKSASENRGTFDPNNADIRFSRRVSSEDKRADREYLEAVNRGDTERANAIVAAAAKKSGYEPSSEFRMNHQAPGPGEYNLANVRESHVVPDDYWTRPSDYLVPEEMEAHGALVSAMRRADIRRTVGKRVDLTGLTVYRAVPKNVKEGEVRNGDWVTPSLQYAKSEGANIPGGYRVIRQHVLLKHLWWDGNSPAELGYHDGRDLAYRDTRNNRKLMDTVTRDDEGNIIPPSQRFNARKDDVRFSRKASDAQGDHQERAGRAPAPRDDVGTERSRATDNAGVEPPNPADEPPVGTPRAPGESLKAYGARIIREGRETMLQGVMRDHGMRLLDAEGRATKLEGRGVLRAYMAGIQRNQNAAEQQFKAAMKVFDGFSRRENLDAIHQWETKQEVTSAPHRLFFAVMDKAFKQRIDAIHKIDPTALQSLIQNYFPHLWKDPTRAAKWYASQLARKPLQGDRSFLKQRVYATIRDGMAAGLEPISANPVDLFLGKLTQMDKFIAFGKLRDELDGMGWLPKLKNDERVPYGYARVDNGAFNGVVVPETLAKDINNYLSPGFNGNKAFRALRWTQNTLTMAQLGWSGFHAGFTTFDNAVLHAEVGLRRALMGDFHGAVHDWLYAPLSIVASPIEGGALNRSWVDVASGAVDGKFDAMAKFFGVDRHDVNTLAILDALEQGGARWKMSRSDYTNDLNQFMRAFRQKDVKGSLQHALGAFGEAGSFYIHHVLVPNQKMAARVLLAKYELDRLAGVFNKHGNADVSAGNYKAIIDAMDPTALRQVMGKVVHDVDSRLGQMAYDNLFWNRGIIQIGQTAFRALGWQIGTVGTVTGGVRDLRRLWSPEKLLAPLDKGGKITDADMGRVTGRTSYLLTLAIVSGMSNALLQYALTGQAPSELKDYFFPRTGRKNSDGSDERLQLPSYWMDHWKIASHPLQTLGHKINPLFELLAEPMRNQNFWGAQIRDPHAKWDEQAAQLGKYWAAQFLPFTFSNGQKVAENGGKMGRQIANFFGVTNAPASVTRSDFQAFVGHNGNKGFGHEMRSQVDLEHSRAVHQAEAAIRQGDTPDMTSMTPHDRKRIARESRSDVPELEFRKMDIEDKLQGWDMATPKERVDYNLRRNILLTAQNAIHTDRFMRLPEDQRQAIYAKLREIRNQPNATQ